jgi:AcrR family transcriptional regulator
VTARAKARPRAAAMTDARQVRTREALHRALLTLLERKEFAEISIRDIAKEADIGYATFFRHHPTKEALLDEIAADQIRQLMQHVLPLMSASDKRAACLALCEYVGAHRAQWAALLTGGAAGTLRAEFIRLAAGAASQLHASHWLPVELGAVYGVAATIEILAWWLRQSPGAYSTDQVAQFLDQLVVGPAMGPGFKGRT